MRIDRISGILVCVVVVLSGGIAVVLCGCTRGVSEGEFDSPDPGSKLYAVFEAGNRRDWTAVPKLIEQLDSDDSAVRMYSIGALERITGKRMGYSPYADAGDRQAAIRRWIDAYESDWSVVSADSEE